MISSAQGFLYRRIGLKHREFKITFSCQMFADSHLQHDDAGRPNQKFIPYRAEPISSLLTQKHQVRDHATLLPCSTTSSAVLYSMRTALEYGQLPPFWIYSKLICWPYEVNLNPSDFPPGIELISSQVLYHATRNCLDSQSHSKPWRPKLAQP